MASFRSTARTICFRDPSTAIIVTVKCPQKVCNIRNVIVNRDSFNRLCGFGTTTGSRYLDDQVINAVLSILVYDYIQTAAQNDVYIFDTYFHDRLAAGMCIKDALDTTWITPNDLAKKRMWIFPICVHQHWYCVVVNVKDKTIYCLDSLGIFHPTSCGVFRRLAVEVFQRAELTPAEWTIDEQLAVPQQNDSESCGLCVIMAVHCLLFDKDIQYQTEKMSAFRLSLAYYLMQHPISTPRLPNLPSNFSIVSDPDFPSPCDELCKSVLTTQSTLVPTPGKCLRLKKKGTEILPKHNNIHAVVKLQQYPANSVRDTNEQQCLHDESHIKSIVESVKMPKEDVELERQAVLRKLAAVTAQVEKCASVSGLHSVMVHLNFASNIIIAKDNMTKHYGVCNEPSNKRIELQRKFYSTRKRSRLANVRIVKPSAQEKICIQDALLNSQSKLYPSEETESRLETSAIGKMLQWFCGKETATRALEGRGMVSVDNLHLQDIPNDVVDTEISPLQQYTEKSAWKHLLQSVHAKRNDWTCCACTLITAQQNMIQCDTCDMWFHWTRVGVTDNPTGDWYCHGCRQCYKQQK